MKSERVILRNLHEPLNKLYNKIGVGKINKDYNYIAETELKPVIDEINSSFNQLEKLVELIENMNKNLSFEGILNYIYSTFSEYIPYSHIGIALLKDNGRVIEASYGVSASELNNLPKKLVGISAEVNKTSLKKIVTEGTPRIINDLENYIISKDTEYNKILLESGVKSSVTLPLKVNKNPIGIIFFSNAEKNMYKEEHIEFLKTLANSIAISLNKNIFIDEMLYSTLVALTKMAEARDEDTADHLDRMSAYAVKITEILVSDNLYCDQITVSFMRGIERFSSMHDIGKVGVKDGILLKPGKLTEDEYEEMKKHVTYGAEVLRTAEKNIARQNYSMFKMGIEIVEGHHEWWDGTGYPYKKSGYEIPLSARIVAVADVFDALTSKRPYKKAFGFEESFNYILDGSGNHFDPSIINSLKKHKEEFFDLYNSFR